MFSKLLIQYIVNRCEGVKKTEAYSDGVMIVPQDMDIHFFTPIQHPNGQAESDVIVTHFDYHAISCNLVKFNILGHDVPTRIKMMEDFSHCDHRTISFNDSDTFSLFQSTEALVKRISITASQREIKLTSGMRVEAKSFCDD